MSSPLASKRRSMTDRAMVSVHQKTAHSRRVAVLAETLRPTVSEHLTEVSPSLLDIGCGDLTLAAAIAEPIAGLDWHGTDIHQLPADKVGVEPWTRYRPFNGTTLPFDDDCFDVGLFADVLHHVPDMMLVDLVRDALRVCSALVVKDHFEYGRISRQSLRAMDVIGNRGYGISIPHRYFSRSRFHELAEAVGADVCRLDVGIELYGRLPVVRHVARPNWQFVAVLVPKARRPQDD